MGTWAMTGLNCRPSACKADALPAELIAPQVHSCYEIVSACTVKEKIKKTPKWSLILEKGEYLKENCRLSRSCWCLALVNSNRHS